MRPTIGAVEEHDVDVAQRGVETRRIGEVAAENVNVGGEVRGAGIARHRANGGARGAQRGEHLAADGAGRAGYEMRGRGASYRGEVIHEE